jgi:hypothetical protein
VRASSGLSDRNRARALEVDCTTVNARGDGGEIGREPRHSET